jgi:hypothetical protein
VCCGDQSFSLQEAARDQRPCRMRWMGISRTRLRPVRARRRRPDLHRPTSAAATTGSEAQAVASLRSCCPSAGAPTSAPAPPLLPATPLAAGAVKGEALPDVAEVAPDAPPCQLPAAPSAAPTARLTAAAVLAHRRSDPAIAGRQVQRSPPSKSAMAPSDVLASSATFARGESRKNWRWGRLL